MIGREVYAERSRSKSIRTAKLSITLGFFYALNSLDKKCYLNKSKYYQSTKFDSYNRKIAIVMTIPQKISKTQINQIKNKPNESGLVFDKYGKSQNINDYSDREISEMALGIYKYSKNILVDGDYFVDLNKVINTKCQLEEVTYYKKPTLEDFKTNAHNSIGNIRTFYIKDYFLITEDEIFGLKEHRITKYLFKIGFLKNGRNKFRGLYSISNDYKTLILEKYPKDLFHPIKKYINGLFFLDEYYISNFVVESKINIHKGK
ncbi:hypothetical protein KFE94_00225 [bacterium SCSIO 12643]|nr:hypothetical protein KFE94_00225 [bacterium SCSIO 12643]